MTKQTDGLGQLTTFAYDENGNQIEVVSPGAARAPEAADEPRTVQRSYDGRDLPWTQTTGSGEDARTKVTRVRRQRQPAPGGQSGRRRRGLEASARRGPGRPGDRGVERDEERHRARVLARRPSRIPPPAVGHARRRGWPALPPGLHARRPRPRERDRCALRMDRPRGRDLAYLLHPLRHRLDQDLERSDARDPDSGEESGGRAFTYAYDRRGLQLTWSSHEERSVRREFAPNATMTKRTAFKPNAVARTYDYRYNENHSMTQMVDQQLNRTTDIGYDAAERESTVDETWSAGRDTKTSYDRNGNVLERRTDGTISGSGYDGGRTTTYKHDPLDREVEMAVAEPGQSANTYLTAYHPSGEVRSQRRPSSVDEQTFYRTDGNVSHMRSGASGEPTNKDQAYTYDRNLNRTSDERGTHAFNARDQLVSWTRGAGQPGAGTTVGYQLDGTGQVTREQDGEAVTESRYNGDRLLSQTETAPAEPIVTRRFDYDDLGAITDETKQVGSAAPALETRYAYDAFERMVSASGPGAADDAVYTFDGLDRRDKKVEGSATRDFSYVGLTEELSREQAEGETRLYEYDSSGEREGLTADAGSSSSHWTYQKDANGSVDALESQDGTVAPANKYAYDPYGESQGAASPAGSAASRNPFRFEGFYHDAETKTYDMQARQYRPDIGRFLTQDRYELRAGTSACSPIR